MRGCNEDGTIDTSFSNVRVDSIVHAIAVQDNGQILIGGQFSEIMIGSSLYTRNGIARLNANGTMDTSFNPNITDVVYTIVLQPDRKILVGGTISSVGGVSHNNIARLNADGSLDLPFSASANNEVDDIALQADGKIILGGYFSQVNGQSRSYLARIFPNGALDPEFSAGVNSAVDSILVLPNGKILIGGSFTQIGGQDQWKLGRLLPGETFDSSFIGSANAVIHDLTLQPDGKILVGGEFSVLSGIGKSCLGRIYPDGYLDTHLTSGANQRINAIALQPDGKILVGGEFTELGGAAHEGIGRINPNGFTEHTFMASVSDPGIVHALAVMPDNKILVGGVFNYLNYESRKNFGRLNADGSLDSGFALAVNGPVYAIATQLDGKVVIGGAFTQVGGTSRPYIARLNTNGSVDTEFYSEVGDIVRTVAIQADGKILIGGEFTSVYSYTRNYIARLLSGGAVDEDFNPGANNTVQSIVAQPNGRILVAGDFTYLSGTDFYRIGKLLNNGSRDTTFSSGVNLGADRVINSIAIQEDRNLVVGGAFTSLCSNTLRPRIGRLTFFGDLDYDFYMNNTNNPVLGLAIQQDGKILAGGTFTYMGTGTRNYLARISEDVRAVENLSANEAGSLVTWLRSGVGPEVYRVTFELSTDGVNFTYLGEGVFLGDGWGLSGLKLPVGQNLYIRARGYTTTGLGNGSISIIESVRNVYYQPNLLYLPLVVKSKIAKDDGKRITVRFFYASSSIH